MNHFIYYVKEMKYSCYRNSQIRRLRLLKILEKKNQKCGKKKILKTDRCQYCHQYKKLEITKTATPDTISYCVSLLLYP